MVLQERHAHRIARLCREEHHALVHGGHCGLQQVGQRWPITLRETQVAQDEGIATRAHLSQRGGASGGRLHGVSITAEECGQPVGKTARIIHNQNRQGEQRRFHRAVLSEKAGACTPTTP
jgi:hypothetical protein